MSFRALACVLAVGLLAPRLALAQTRFDPSWVAPRLADACEVHASGMLSHASPVGPSALALAHVVELRTPAGYSSDARLHTVELRERPSLAIRWRRALEGPITALAGSPDGAHVAIGTVRATLILDARDGRELARVDAPGSALAYGPSSLAVASGSRVTWHARQDYAQLGEAVVSGMAPTVVHAAMLDGTCEERFEQTEARATALAVGADGAIYAGASDGSVRALGTTRRFDLPGARAAAGYATHPILLAPRGRSLVSVWSDGRVVTLDARTLQARRTVGGGCSAVERSRAGGQCGGDALVAAIDGERVATPGRVRTLGGRSVATMRTLHAGAVLLAGDELWLFGSTGTAERWSLASGGRFLGYLPIAGRMGAVEDVSPDGRYVAIRTPAEPRTLASIERDEDRYSVRIFDTRTERELRALRRTGTSARFLGGGRVAIHAGSAIELVELASGRLVRRVPLGSGDHALIEVSGERLLVSDGVGRARVVDVASGAIVELALGSGAVTRARFEGDRVALLVFEPPPGWSGHAYRVEVFSLSGGRAERVRRIDGVSTDSLELVSSVLAFVRDGVARGIDLRSGDEATLSRPGEPVSSILRAGDEWLLAPQGAEPLRRGTQLFGPRTMRVVRAQALPHATLLYALGGAVYVVGPDGTTRGSIESVDGGFAVSSAAGHASASAEARPALATRDGDTIRACGPRAQRPALLEALLAP